MDSVEQIGNQLEKIVIGEKDAEDQQEENKYELALLYDERVKNHPDNHEEIQARCSLVFEELNKQGVSWIFGF